MLDNTDDLANVSFSKKENASVKMNNVS